MPAHSDENLDDVISDLVDEDAGDRKEEDGSPAFAGIEAPEGAPEGPVVRLTDRAARQIRRIRDNEDLDDDLYLRVAVEGGGCSGLSYKLGFDYETDEDHRHASNDIEIVIDNKHLMYLEGITIDYPDGLDARGFTFDNPNAEETCGCGTSFAT